MESKTKLKLLFILWISLNFYWYTRSSGDLGSIHTELLAIELSDIAKNGYSIHFWILIMLMLL